MKWWKTVGGFFGITGGLPENSSEQSSQPIPSRVGPGLIVLGKIEGEGDLSIAGRFEGTVTVSGTVVVEEGAEVEAEITAFDVTIAGQVRGHLTVSGKVEILPTGVLTGSLKTGSLMAADGASVRGEIWVERAVPVEASAQGESVIVG